MACEQTGLTLEAWAVGLGWGRGMLFPSLLQMEWWQASLWTTANAPASHMSPFNLTVTVGPWSLFSFYR